MNAMIIEWILAHETALWWLAAASIVTFVGTLIAVPWLVVRIPSDYFTYGKRHKTLWADQHPVVRAVLLIGKNMLGGVFVTTGIVMLVLPGQGLLTITIGVMLLDFPGKYRLDRWFATRRPALRSINWIRRRAERTPLVFDR